METAISQAYKRLILTAAILPVISFNIISCSQKNNTSTLKQPEISATLNILAGKWKYVDGDCTQKTGLDRGLCEDQIYTSTYNIDQTGRFSHQAFAGKNSTQACSGKLSTSTTSNISITHEQPCTYFPDSKSVSVTIINENSIKIGDNVYSREA